MPFALAFEVRQRRQQIGPAGLRAAVRRAAAGQRRHPGLPRRPSSSTTACAPSCAATTRGSRSCASTTGPPTTPTSGCSGSPPPTRRSGPSGRRTPARAPRSTPASRRPNGDVLILVDADGLFRPDTVTRLLRGFRHDRASVRSAATTARSTSTDVLTRLLALISHVGTGPDAPRPRRAGLPAGRLGQHRRLPARRPRARTGPLRTDTLGEDLELTWRVHRAGYQVTFAPDALVYAESPSTLRGLWRQRVRWARGLLQATSLHRSMIGNPRYGTFGVYLLYNTLAQVVGPFFQVLAVVVVAALVAVRRTRLAARHVVELDPAARPADLRRAAAPGHRARPGPGGPAVPLDRRAVAALLHPHDVRDARRRHRSKLRNAENRWNKLDRSGTVSVLGPRRRRWPWLLTIAFALAAAITAAVVVARPWEEIPPSMTVATRSAGHPLRERRLRHRHRPRHRLGRHRRPPRRAVGANAVDLNAGRVEFTAFDWAAHPDAAAEPGTDHLARAANALHLSDDGAARQIGLIVDAFVPQLIADDPSLAGVVHGRPALAVQRLRVADRPGRGRRAADQLRRRPRASGTCRARSSLTELLPGRPTRSATTTSRSTGR